MARVTYVKSARASKKDRRCFTCNTEIGVGESYQHVSLKTGPYSSVTRNWCSKHTPRQSQLTSNSRLSTLYSVQENIETSIASFLIEEIDADSLKSDAEAGADEAESVADEYSESADNIPESLQQSSQAEEMREKADNIREWAEAIRASLSDLEDFDDADEDYDADKCAECDEDRDADCHNENNEEEYDHDFEEPEKPEEKDRSAAVSDLESALGELSI